MTDSEIRGAFADGPALVSYVAAGDPSAEASKEYVEALVEGGSDVIELGLPFSEPVAEGTTIQNAIKRALDAGMTPDAYLDLVRELDVDVPIVCMTYYNLIYQYGESEARSASENASGDEPRASGGPEEFVEAAAEAGISGFVVPDLPVNESEAMYEACREHGLDLIFIVAPTTTPERLESMLDRTTGFVYVQGRLGTTGARDDVSEDTPEALERLQDADVPKAVGFGISSGEQAREVIASGADGVIVGSAYVDIVADGVENDLPAGEVADRLEELAAELKQGARKGLPEPERK
ncbi:MULTISPECIES: tryptophan synthase subunit alpha [Halobacterium]|uniref:tryptophan synthase subunit alpha n=1 Tax=Halobacterium TaxID=2239 RepID=UPI00073EFAB3|nr:tryptophan synthase subunit alpha [Halobacterium sp. CBA1132]MCG1002227.1 tryptophan synthase subunit alpha [Halobacterium noricense]